jgi:hypothetical protein
MNYTENEDAGSRAEIVVIAPDDAAALGKWAERWCRGWSVPGLASALGVEATLDAIIGYLSEGLEGEARQVVIDTCERELKGE